MAAGDTLTWEIIPAATLQRVLFRECVFASKEPGIHSNAVVVLDPFPMAVPRGIHGSTSFCPEWEFISRNARFGISALIIFHACLTVLLFRCKEDLILCA